MSVKEKSHQLAYLKKIAEKIGRKIHELPLSEPSLPKGAYFTRIKKDIISLALTDLALETIPEELGMLHELNVLDLSNNNFREVPDVLARLTKLAVLNLSNNQLVSLPAWLGDLRFLKVLSLANNHLRTLPASMDNLTLLRRLFLQGNDIQRLPFALLDLHLLSEIHLDFRAAMKKPVKAVLTALEARGCTINANYHRR